MVAEETIQPVVTNEDREKLFEIFWDIFITASKDQELMKSLCE